MLFLALQRGVERFALGHCLKLRTFEVALLTIQFIKGFEINGGSIRGRWHIDLGLGKGASRNSLQRLRSLHER